MTQNERKGSLSDMARTHLQSESSIDIRLEPLEQNMQLNHQGVLQNEGLRVTKEHVVQWFPRIQYY